MTVDQKPFFSSEKSSRHKGLGKGKQCHILDSRAHAYQETDQKAGNYGI